MEHATSPRRPLGAKNTSTVEQTALKPASGKPVAPEPKAEKNFNLAAAEEQYGRWVKETMSEVEKEIDAEACPDEDSVDAYCGHPASEAEEDNATEEKEAAEQDLCSDEPADDEESHDGDHDSDDGTLRFPFLRFNVFARALIPRCVDLAISVPVLVSGSETLIN